MSQTDNYLILAKSASLYNSGDDGVVVVSMPPLVATETKDVEVSDWLDEDGLDSYDTERAYFKAFDAEVGLACKGDADACRNAYIGLIKFSTQGRTSMMMYSSFTRTGKAGVFYKSSTQPEIYNTGEVTKDGKPIFIWEWKSTFNITKPQSNVNLSVNAKGDISLSLTSDEL